MNSGLLRLNGISLEEATRHLLRCCGSSAWASTMAYHRPFNSIDQLHRLATEVWWRLETDDWLEAFSAHPKIGGKSDAGAASNTYNWSTNEQAGVAGADDATAQQLTVGNENYRTRFGFIFIICATGKSSAQMLDALESRLQNSPVDELRVAATEQMEITHLRIEKLLDELEHDAQRT